MDAKMRLMQNKARIDSQIEIQRTRDIAAVGEAIEHAAASFAAGDNQQLVTNLTNALTFLARGLPEGTDVGDGVLKAGKSGVFTVEVKRGTFAR